MGPSNAPVDSLRPPRLGDVLRLMDCADAPAVRLVNHTLQLNGLCVDSHTVSLVCGWQRQCEAALWECDPAAAAHTWRPPRRAPKFEAEVLPHRCAVRHFAFGPSVDADVSELLLENESRRPRRTW